jgi:hypothetical protein
MIDPDGTHSGTGCDIESAVIDAAFKLRKIHGDFVEFTLVETEYILTKVDGIRTRGEFRVRLIARYPQQETP